MLTDFELERLGLSLRIRPSVNRLYIRLFMGNRGGFGVGFGFLENWLESVDSVGFWWEHVCDT